MRVDARGARIAHQQPSGMGTVIGKRWEYKVQRMDADADLSQFGGEGWELVSIVPNQMDPSTVTAYFKRAA